MEPAPRLPPQADRACFVRDAISRCPADLSGIRAAPLCASLLAEQYLVDLGHPRHDLRRRRGRARSPGRLWRPGFVRPCGSSSGSAPMPLAFLSAGHRGRAGVAPVAFAVSMLFALLTGVVCLRTKGAYFIMITLAFGRMIYFVATSLAPYGGDNGLTIAARNTVAGFSLLKSDRAFYYVTLYSACWRPICSAALWSHRASAVCCAAPRRTRRGWRRCDSRSGSSSSSPM